MITLALVGIGRWGKNYIKTINNLPFCKLPEKFIKTKNYRDLLAIDNIDGVIIATPASTHFQIAKEFLERGFNLLIEKPVTTSYKDALELYKIADACRSSVMVGHTFLYNPAFVEVKNLVKKIGKINYISSEGMDYGPIRSDISALWDWAPHDISMCLELFGTLPDEVCGHGFNLVRPNTKFYDACLLKLKFPNNIYVFINVNDISPVKKRTLTVVGEKDTLIFDDTSEKKISLTKNFDADKKISYPSFSNSNKSPLSMEILTFVNLLKNKVTINDSSLKMGINVVKVLEACEKSIRANGKIVVV